MKCLMFLFITFFAFALGDLYFDVAKEQWNSFKLTYQKDYPDKTENAYRFKIFLSNSIKILQHNQRYKVGLETYSMKMNQFGDLFTHEVVNLMNGLNETLVKEQWNNLDDIEFLPPANIDLPPSIDWVAKGAVTPVKNQGQCGSCWAFSSTGALEGQTFRARQKLISLSEQNLVDCSGKYGNNGCGGGWMPYAFQYIKANRGIDTEEGYPYEAQDSTCRYQESKKGATDSGFTKIRSGDENQLMQAVATVGPIAVAIDASHSSFHFYHEGIYSENQCHQPVDHAVLVVGYGKDSKTNSDYWMVKNSWGQTWGSQGYIKILKGRNMCQIASYACYPLV